MPEQKNLKLIPYGIAGFKQIRADNYVYVDKTRYIEVLEKSGIKYPSLSALVVSENRSFLIR